MASSTITTNAQALATTSSSRQAHLLPPRSFSATGSACQEDPGLLRLNSNMSFSMSQAQAGGMMMPQPGSYRQYEAQNNAHRSSEHMPQIYSAAYSGVDVYEMEVNTIAVMRRRKDSWLNATQILKVAGIEKGKRTKVLEKEILIGEHEKVQGGYGKYQGTWIKFERGLEFCKQYGVEQALRPLLTYDMGQDGGIAGRGLIDTPTKEQAMAAQRKRLYNSSVDNRNSGPGQTFFKNISNRAAHAVAAISKARFDSPGPRGRNGAGSRPPSFNRQSSSQQIVGSQESAFPGNSQQSIQSFASMDSYAVSGQQDSAYATQFSQPGRDFEEPARKRMRPSPGLNDSQATVNDEYLHISMREPSPTEPNDSFVYHQQFTQSDGAGAPLPPLPKPIDQQGKAKKDLLMSLFTNPQQTDFSQHKTFLTLSPEELDLPIDESLNSPLIWAATLARKHVLKALIDHGASIFRVNSNGETALMRSAIVTNNLEQGTFSEILELLGPTIDCRDNRGRTVLHHIAVTSAVKGRSQASKYHLECLCEFVVKQGSLPDSQQSLSKGSVAPNLLNLGRFMSEVVNVQDKCGDTALNLASRIGNRSIITQLMEVGADATIANRSNLSPMDFGIGDAADFANRSNDRGTRNTLGNDTKESSSEIISSITTLVTEAENEFSKEMEKKQSLIDGLHDQLRDASGELGEQRRRAETLQAENHEREMHKLKTTNLFAAFPAEQNHLAHLRGHSNQMEGDVSAQLGEADTAYTVPDQVSRTLGQIDLSQPLNIDPQTRQYLSTALQPVHVLRAKLAAYQANNQELEQRVLDLKSKSSETAGKYRKLISLCTGTDENNVDNQLEGLLRAVDSEQDDVELARVREFLQRVDGA